MCVCICVREVLQIKQCLTNSSFQYMLSTLKL